MKKFAKLFLSLFLLVSTVAPSFAFAEVGKTGWVVEGEKKYYYDKPGVKHTGLF
ncbi:hypothetical protein ACFCVQ_27725 [Bacillus thuringiensis]|uniref:hypothetical protein n=1 Tax=Bacillus thuringiensis TaxID=1428 RepID=UPI0035D83E76